MYRRRNIKPVQQNEEKTVQVEKKVEKKVENKKEEPVIKAVTCPRELSSGSLGKAPILNILRNIKYLNEENTSYYSVPFEIAVDLLLSQGYLDVNFTRYNQKSLTDSTAILGSDKENVWHELYRKTTKYERKQLVAGDIIFTRDARKTFAFIVTDVYTSGDEADGTKSNYLDYISPLGERKNNPAPESRIMQTCTDCKGRCYMFAKEVTLDDIIEKLSKDTITGDLRYLDPSNASVYDADATIPDNWTCNRKVIQKQVIKSRFDTTFDGEPKTQDELPTVTSTTEAKFNLQGITTVQGWLIYLKSSVELTKDSVLKDVKDSITGDVVKTGVISIGVKGGKILSVDSIFDIPYPESTATSWPLSYRGNCTAFASEPLNSDEYQTNYGDTQGRNSYSVTESDIYSFMKYSPPEP